MQHRILIVDDHLVVREGLKLLIETSDKYVIVGEAENGRIAIDLVEKLKPDVILMDLYMPVMSGLEAITELRRTNPEIPIVILTTYNEDQLMMKGIEAGAKGYLLKDTGVENLFESIDSAIRGETLLQPEITERIQNYKTKLLKEQSKSKVMLTPREMTILQAIARGSTSKEIAYDIGIAERTVKSKLTSIYNKLGVDSRTEAVVVAIQSGIIHL
ncbi:DNA-binding response regulator [Priestia megaterium]|jgi:two-component system, NarL family, response regulator YdfI|uniref:response regulator n=1 Tax=Priestia megaterium TaxID=1404 RepID=UPI000BA7C048|nr:response regulator transcription factor [Priestia megaterium]MDH3187731.1 response regulator transcription factor [Priestia megaterium]MED3881936.1 response regulator transcription factor [Priestia megaterium]MED3939832.1 response regulator transcription factor [Priestia megaterium]PAK48082.1 DNA-binding response regulator [Priestia megaterium]PFE28472.1 DNA-binding response regulator [Priestia megaterium]